MDFKSSKEMTPMLLKVLIGSLAVFAVVTIILIFSNFDMDGMDKILSSFYLLAYGSAAALCSAIHLNHEKWAKHSLVGVGASALGTVLGIILIWASDSIDSMFLPKVVVIAMTVGVVIAVCNLLLRINPRSERVASIKKGAMGFSIVAGGLLILIILTVSNIFELMREEGMLKIMLSSFVLAYTLSIITPLANWFEKLEGNDGPLIADTINEINENVNEATDNSVTDDPPPTA